MSLACTLFFGSLLSATFAARVTPAKAILDVEGDAEELTEYHVGDNNAHIDGNYVVMQVSACDPAETYGLDDKGRCRLDINDNGVLDRFAPDECCLACDPGATYGRDDSGRCRTDVNKNGVLDRFANGECCECDSRNVYGRDKDGRCRTDVNSNGLLDRFAKDVCCGDKVAYGTGGNGPKFTFKHPTFGDIATKEQCESEKLGSDDKSMSTRNSADCIACVTEGSKFITHPERCVADASAAKIKSHPIDSSASNLVPFPSRPDDMMTFPGGCPQRNPGNPVTWVAFPRKCVTPGRSGMTVHGSSTTGNYSPMPPIVANKCCKTAAKCPEASVKIPEKVPAKYDINTLRSSGECVAADSGGKPTQTIVENVCCADDGTVY